MFRSINYRLVLRFIGLICIVESAIMLSNILVALYYEESILPFVYAIIVCLLIGGVLMVASVKNKNEDIGRREGMVTVTFTWIILSVIGAIPFVLSGVTSNFINALFETVSGFTTTGVTTFDDVESFPKSILFWRSLMQWQGGIGIIVFTLALVPLFGGAVSKLYFEETTGITQDKFAPKVKDMAMRILGIYVLETVVLIFLLCIGKMNIFDSICHSLTTVPTGGFSTKNSSIQWFNSPYSEYVITIFMFLGGVNLALVYLALVGKSKRAIKDDEFRWYFMIIVIFTLVTTVWLYVNNIYESVESCFRHAVFNVVSLGTSTGLNTGDITSWKPFFWMLAFFLMYVNACTGSTAGGLKVSRFAVLIKNIKNEFKKIAHPSLVTPVVFNKKIVSISVVHQILAFSITYTIVIFFGSLLLMIDGNEFVESLSAAITCVSNTGFSIGGYSGSYYSASGFDKLTMCGMMIVGRLEVFTVIAIFTNYFWKK